MGRSVNYLDNAEIVLYFEFDEGEDENGEFDADLASIYWQDMKENLIAEIQKRLPSYYEADNLWDNNETRIILQNNLCNIGISEYCGLVSLSVGPKNNEYDSWHEDFAKRHANQIRKSLEAAIDAVGLKRLNKLGTFSNGEGVYELANAKG